MQFSLQPTVGLIISVAANPSPDNDPIKVIIDYINIIGNDSLCYSFSIVSSGLFLIADFCYEYKDYDNS